MKTKSFLILCIIIMRLSVVAQVKIGDNTTTINSASLLELETTNKGFVLPRVSITNVNSSAPLAAGLLTGTVVYNTNGSTTGGSGVGIYYWDGNKWNFIANTTTIKSYWSLTGNSGTSASTNFIGTTDAVDFIARTNNAERLRITSGGNVGIGITNPSYKLAVLSASNPLYLSGVQATSTFSSDSVLTINAGIVKKTPYSSLTGNFWSLLGNSGTSALTNFIGTSDAVDFVTRTNNTERLRITSAGNVGIGLANPSNKLAVLSASDPLYLSGVQATSTFSSDSVLTINAGIVKKAPYSSLAGNFWSLTGNSGTNYATNFIGTTDNVSLRFRTNNTEQMILDSLGTLSVGSYGAATFNTNNPPKLSVDYGTTTSNTIAYFRGSIDDYFQINLRNKSNGINASTDYVATADDGTDSTNYIDFGINSSTYAPGVENFGGPHDGYLYTYARNLLIGAAATNSDIIFLLGGGKTRNNAIMRLNASDGHVVLGRGDNSTTAIGTTLRAPNVQSSSTNLTGGTLTVSGGSSTGTATGGSLNISGGATSGAGSGGSVNITGGNTIGGTIGPVNVNASKNGATNINTGTSTGNVTIGNSNNNILLPKFNVAGSIIYTTAATGQIAGTGSNMTWDDANNRLGIGLTNPGYKLSVLASSDPLYLSGVQATSTFSTDSILTINAGIVKKSPYTSLTGGNNWSITGNAGTNAGTNFLGTTDGNALMFKVNNIVAGYLGLSGSSYATSLGVGSSGSSTGFQATAIGSNAQATANDATALGYNSTASIQDGIAIGNGSQAITNNETLAIGHNSTASAYQSIALGVSANASTNNQTIAIGSTANATGYQGIAIGYSADATTNNNALAIGVNANATGYQSAAIGNGASASGQNSTAIGNGATTSTDNTLILGNGANVGIGTSTPANKLQVVGTNPLSLLGVQTGAFTDSLIVIRNGRIMKVQPLALYIIKGQYDVVIPTYISNNSGLTVTVAVTSAPYSVAGPNPVVLVNPEINLPDGLIIAWARVSATNTVSINFRNVTNQSVPPQTIKFDISVQQ